MKVGQPKHCCNLCVVSSCSGYYEAYPDYSYIRCILKFGSKKCLESREPWCETCVGFKRKVK